MVFDGRVMHERRDFPIPISHDFGIALTNDFNRRVIVESRSWIHVVLERWKGIVALVLNWIERSSDVMLFEFKGESTFPTRFLVYRCVFHLLPIVDHELLHEFFQCCFAVLSVQVVRLLYLLRRFFELLFPRFYEVTRQSINQWHKRIKNSRGH